MSKEMAGLKEATSGPSEHDCSGTLVDATISRQRVVLVCYRCNTFWHTGKYENELTNSVIALVRCADTLYSLYRDERHRRLREIRDARVDRMYKLYMDGWSLAMIAARYKKHPNSIRVQFLRRGYELRDRHDRRHSMKSVSDIGPRFCHHCGSELIRKTWLDGTMERRSTFLCRRFCDRYCFFAHVSGEHAGGIYAGAD